MGIEAVVFDLGNVFVDVVHARAAKALEEFCADGPVRLQEAITGSTLLHGIERGEVDARTFFTAVAEHASCSAGFDAFCAAFCDIFIAVPEMIAAHAQLRARGTRTYMCSNTSALHFEHLKRTHAFISAFDGYFLSYELGFMKPHAGIYKAVEDGTGLTGDALVFIDDRQDNVEAAAARGWIAIHHLAPARTLERLRELSLL